MTKRFKSWVGKEIPRKQTLTQQFKELLRGCNKICFTYCCGYNYGDEINGYKVKLCPTCKAKLNTFISVCEDELKWLNKTFGMKVGNKRYLKEEKKMSEMIVLSKKEKEEVVEQFIKEQAELQKFYEEVVKNLNLNLKKKRKEIS